MKTIRILSESAELGKRLRDILYQAGHAEISVSGLTAAPQSDILIIYAKSRIPDIIQYASDCNAAVILLLAFRSPAIDTGRVQVVLTIAGSVLVIFVLANLFTWLRESAEARKLNRDLAAFQQLHE